MSSTASPIESRRSRVEEDRCARALPALLLLVVSIPGQASASAPRFWIVAGLLPLLGALWWWRPTRAWWALAPWGALVVLAAVAALWVPRPGAAVWQSLLFWGWLGAALLGVRLAQSPAMWPRLTRTLSAAGGIAAACALTPWWWREGVFGNPNMLAGFLVLTSLWAASGWWASQRAQLSIERATRAQRLTGRRRRRVESTLTSDDDLAQAARWRHAHAASLALQSIVLVLAQSLGAWIAVVVGSGAVAALSLAKAGRRRALAVLLVMAVLSGIWLAQSLYVREHLRGRAFLAEVSAEIAWSAPLGVGPGQFPAAWMQAQARRFDGDSALVEGSRDLWTHAHHAHNEPLHMAVEMGWVGMLFLLAPALLALVRPAGPLAAWGGVASGMTLGLVSLPLYEPATAALFAVGVGLGLGSRFSAHDVEGDSSRSASMLGPRVLIGVAAVGLLAASVELLSDRLLSRGARGGDAITLERAVTLSLQPERAMRHLAVVLRPSNPRRAHTLAFDATLRDPSPTAWAQVGELSAASGDLDGAVDAYERAIVLQPWFFTGHFNLAVLCLQRGEVARARRHALRARSLRPHDRRLGALDMLSGGLIPPASSL